MSRRMDDRVFGFRKDDCGDDNARTALVAAQPAIRKLDGSHDPSSSLIGHRLEGGQARRGAERVEAVSEEALL